MALIKNEEVKMSDGFKKLVYRTFKNDRVKMDQSYLTALLTGNNCNLYRRLLKKFTELRQPVNSMVATSSSRFTGYLSHYYYKAGEEEIIEIPVKIKNS